MKNNKNEYMKRMLAIGAAAALLLGACSKGEVPPPEEGEAYGTLAIDASCVAAVDAVTRARVELPDHVAVPDPQDMTMRISSTTPGLNYNRVWARVGNYDVRKDQLLEGEYSLEIYSTKTWQGVDQIEEGADKPYFEGTVSGIAIVRRTQTPVTVRAALANTIVRIEFTDSFRSYFANGATFTLKTAAENEFTVSYTADDPAVADTWWYVRPGKPFTITGRATKQTPSATADPETVRFNPVENAAPQPATLYTYRFDISGVGSTGPGGVTITLNGEPVDTEVVDEELNPDSKL